MRRPALPVVFAVLLLGVVAARVAAHADFESASPSPGETVTGSPDELVVRFTQDLDHDRSSLVVVDAAGNEVATGGEPGGAPRELRLALPELAPGDYEVRWTSWSAEDNEGHRGMFRFSVLPTPAPTPSPGATPTRKPSTSTQPSAAPDPTLQPLPSASAPVPPALPATADQPADASVVIPIVAAIVAVAALGAWLLRRRSA